MTTARQAEEENRPVATAWLVDYWQQSRRPLASLVFVLPLLVLYEGGVLLLGPTAVRNGADVWLRQLLDGFGLTSYFLLPILTVAILLGWHHTTRDRWRVAVPVLYGMLAESAFLGVLLLAVGYLQWTVVSRVTTWLPPATDMSAPIPSVASRVPLLGQLIGFVGAGVYEEVLFRLLLLPLVFALLGYLLMGIRWRVGSAIIISSLVFSAAHYVSPQGEVFDWFSFVFRALAGGVFALLFVFRGFGIAAGCHALYDIFAGVL